LKQIEVFVNSVYQNASGNRIEIRELKAEMKNHLLEAVHELKAEGKTEQEAIDIAIERFGGEIEMRSIVGQLFKAQKTFAKWVLYTSIAFLIICSTIFSVFMTFESNKVNLNIQYASQILDKLGDNKGVSVEVKEDIQAIVQNSEYIYAINIYDDKKLFSSTELIEPEYSYKKKPLSPDWLYVNFNGYGESNDTWHVNINTKHYEASAVGILLLGIIIYWTLFSIWAIINAYHKKRLNIGWIVIFVLFNALGYLVYHFVEKKMQSNTIS
jgi:hypothetical protein